MVRILSSNYNEHLGYDRVSNSSWRKDRSADNLRQLGVRAGTGADASGRRFSCIALSDGGASGHVERARSSQNRRTYQEETQWLDEPPAGASR